MSLEIAVTPLAIAHWSCLSELFARSPGVDACWCMWPRRLRGTHTPDRERNRGAMKALLESGESPGLVAWSGEKAVGWCAVGPRREYPQYERTTNDDDYWAIPCLYVDPTADRTRIARSLIDAAVALAAGNAAVAVEGPPPYWLPGDADAVRTASETFLNNGFETIDSGARMPVLRRILRNQV